MDSNSRLVTRIKRVEAAPTVAARLWLRGGGRLEEKPGQALICGRALAEGTQRRAWHEIVLEAENRGMILQSFGSHESIGVAVDALAEDWSEALEWLAELVLEPSFPADRCDWLQRQAQGELESLLDQPALRTGRAFLEHLYHPHPYSRPIQGSPDDLQRLSAGDAADFHRRALGWGGLVVVTGLIDEEAVEKRLADLLGKVTDGPGLTGEAETLPPVEAPVGYQEMRRETIAGETDQAHLYAGHLTVQRGHPDGPALSLLGVILGAGAGISGRLPKRIREREGLAYNVDVSTFAGAGIDPGRFMVYVGTSPETADAAERAIREEMIRLVEDGISLEELDEARSYIIGRDPFRRETARQWAELLAEASFYGLRIDEPGWVRQALEGLTKEDVEDAARRWLRAADLKVTVGLPAS